MTRPRLLLALGAALALVVAVSGVQLSGATYTGTSRYGAVVTAARDWTPPVVAVASPGPAVSGTATITATASDAQTSVRSVTVQYAAADSDAWVTLCTTTTAPYSCAWNTKAGSTPDGSYALRATATDEVGLTATSAEVTTRVVNTAAVVLTHPGDNLRGTITLHADYLNGVPGGAVLSFQYVTTGASSWTNVPGCGPDGLKVTSRTCSWASTVTGSYDLRAVATVSGQPTLYDVESDLTIDNTAPTVALAVPAGTLSGTVLLSAAATDDDSGIAGVAFQYRLVGAPSWTNCADSSTEPWTCWLPTAALTDGSYELRAVATDVAGNTTTATETRTVRNTVSAVSITSPAPGSTVRGTVAVTADASSTADVTSVRVEARSSGGTWTTVCTDPATPYACSWNTTTISTATADLRAVLTDGTGLTTTSTTVTVNVDNSALHGADAQVTNVVTAGKPAATDRLTLTYSSLVDLNSIKAGWTGAATTVTMTFNDKNVSGHPLAGYDWAGFAGANLGRLSFTQNYVQSRRSTVFTATMVATTQKVNGLDATVITITLGGISSGSSNLSTANVTGTLTWYPSTAVRTPEGSSSSGSLVTEAGIVDKDW